ncbi:MAG: NADP-dependent isocitrate dehydrogenase [Microbacteriaceae bacterium]
MTIVYTHTDEAPALATASLLPIVTAFAQAADVEIEIRDISLSGRILAAFPERLSESQRVPDALKELGELAMTPAANIIKLPNISASIPQLKAAIAELQAGGFDIPDYPEEPHTDVDRDARARYDRIKGSAVNPVLREGNSDRRAPLSVKAYARKHPHVNKPFATGSKTRVATMGHDDFFSNEKSVVMTSADTLAIRHTAIDGTETILKSGLTVLDGEIVDATFMSAAALDEFLAETLRQAKSDNVLYSVHVKATMMKVSDPIIFGHVVRAFFADVFTQHGAALEAAGLTANDGLGSILAGLSNVAGGEQIASAFEDAIAQGPRLSYTNSDKGITNLHVPSDVIVDASMPALVRNGGKLWGVGGGEDDTIAVIPDSSYAGVYQATIDDVIAHGPLDPATIGTVPNVGLMAQAAEEYGSHDKTFEISADGRVDIVNAAGAVLITHDVHTGDIWRATQAKDVPIRDWVKLAVSRARATGSPAVFWLDEKRAHDAQIIAKVRTYLKDHDTTGLTIEIMAPAEATTYSLARIRKGEDTISVTGNVLRDYLTDLFPILEVGTSAKMLSIVPLLNGGGLFETGAGGSAPKHVQQLVEENFLRWDSLGEFFALAASLEHFSQTTGNAKALVLANTLDRATGTFLEEDRSPGRKLGMIDNRGSHFYLGLYWAQELATQNEDAQLAAAFAPVAKALAENEEKIVGEMIAVQGKPVDIGGYYRPDVKLVEKVMRPSATLNGIMSSLG